MRGKIAQFVSSVIVAFPNFLFGIVLTWPSYTKKTFQSEDSPLSENFTNVHYAFLSALPQAGNLIGTPAAGLIIQYWGNRNGCYLAGLILLLSWAVLAVSTKIVLVLIARAISGLGMGMVVIITPIFIAEVSDQSIRGFLVTCQIILYYLGVLLSYLLGWFFGYHVIIGVNITLSLVHIIMLAIVKESPKNLLKRGREKEAYQSAAYYTGKAVNSKEVLDFMSDLRSQLISPQEMDSINSEATLEDPEKEKLRKAEDMLSSLHKSAALPQSKWSPTTRRALTVTIAMLSLQVYMGNLAVQVNADYLFSKAAPSLSSNLCSVVLALVLLLGGSCSAVFTDKAGRRILQVYGSAAAFVCLMALGTLVETPSAPQWLIPVFILAFVFVFNVGPGTIPFVMISEYFIDEVKNIACILSIESMWLSNCLLLLVFPIISDKLSLSTLFYGFGTVAGITSLLSYFIVPETKGLSPQAVQELFARSSKK